MYLRLIPKNWRNVELKNAWVRVFTLRCKQV
jgi:hypothetical protein